MRLFDENTFRSYGPFRYDLGELIAWKQSQAAKLHPVAARKRPA
jgi:hypothetical protein